MRTIALLRHPSPSFIWGATAVGLLVLLAFFVSIARDFYRSSVLINELAAQNIAMLLERNIARDMELYDRSLLSTLESVNDPEVMAQSPRVRHKALFEHSASARGLDSLVVLDEMGATRFDSLSLDPRVEDLSGHEYFKVHKQARSGIGPYISKPFRARVQENFWSISISRKIARPDGRFAGVVSGTVKLDYFRDEFRSVTLGAGGTITLFRDDGTLLVRDTETSADSGIGSDWSTEPLFRHAGQRPSGIYHADSAPDNIARIYAYRKIGALPLIVSVGLSKEGVLAPWWSKVQTLAIIYVLMATSVVFLVYLFVSELKHRRQVAITQAQLARRDALTQLGNRRAFEEALEREWRRAIRNRTPLSLIIFDIDHFKRYNDTYGHREGDKVIAEVARTIAAAMRRPSDIAARYGGEELAVILSDTGEAGAVALAETIRQNVASLAIAHAGNEQAIVTVSGGVATIIPAVDQNADTLIRLADAALYSAKSNGRNRTVASPAPDPYEDVLDAPKMLSEVA
jgi:diguanylate cyclase (GGDEF)-like protein